jgi:hypothetical protein
METTNPLGTAIQPVVFPLNQGTATILSVLVHGFKTNAVTTGTYWQLLTEDGKQLQQGNYDMTPEQFAIWGQDNSVVDDYVAEVIGVTIITE